MRGMYSWGGGGCWDGNRCLGRDVCVSTNPTLDVPTTTPSTAAAATTTLDHPSHSPLGRGGKYQGSASYPQAASPEDETPLPEDIWDLPALGEVGAASGGSFTNGAYSVNGRMPTMPLAPERANIVAEEGWRRVVSVTACARY